jgi:hypothetical protein
MNLDEQYVSEMARWEMGRALFHPVRSRDLRIGDVGYFAQGHWNVLGHITDHKALNRYKKTLEINAIDPSYLKAASPDGSHKWGPLVSKHVTGVNLSAAISAS